jgi:hypothetical protein
MAKRLTWAMILALMLLFGVGVLTNELRSTPADALYASVHQGMMENEALAALGKPTVTMPSDAQGRPLGYTWAVPGGRIWVFVHDGVVVATELEEDWPRVGTFIARMFK